MPPSPTGLHAGGEAPSPSPNLTLNDAVIDP